MRAVVTAALLCAGCSEPPYPQPAGGVGVPATERCNPVRMWSADAIDLEVRLAERIDEVREHGRDCGARGRYDPAPSLTSSGRLICAARLHSLDMATRDFVSHVNPDEATPWDRMRAVEYTFTSADEVIAAGDLDADELFDEAWIVRNGSCAAIMADPYVEFGIGVHIDDATALARYFTLLLARPTSK